MKSASCWNREEARRDRRPDSCKASGVAGCELACLLISEISEQKDSNVADRPEGIWRLSSAIGTVEALVRASAI